MNILGDVEREVGVGLRMVSDILHVKQTGLVSGGCMWVDEGVFWLVDFFGDYVWTVNGILRGYIVVWWFLI